MKAKMAGSIKLSTPKSLARLNKVVYGNLNVNTRASKKGYMSAFKVPKAVKFKF